MFRRRKLPFERLGNGRIAVNLSAHERQLLGSLPQQLKELMATDDPSLRRLFPVAYLGDAERNDEYQRLMRDELLASRMVAAELLETQADATEISTDDLGLWMNTANSIRLVLGTQLDVSEEELDLDDDDPRLPAYEVYGWLGYLVEYAVRALSSGFEERDDEDFHDDDHDTDVHDADDRDHDGDDDVDHDPAGGSGDNRP